MLNLGVIKQEAALLAKPVGELRDLSLAEAHGGRIWAESEVGKGNTFSRCRWTASDSRSQRLVGTRPKAF